MSELKKAKKLNFEQKLNGRGARIRTTYHSMNVIHLLRNICREASVYILKPCKRNTPTALKKADINVEVPNLFASAPNLELSPSSNKRPS